MRIVMQPLRKVIVRDVCMSKDVDCLPVSRGMILFIMFLFIAAGYYGAKILRGGQNVCTLMKNANLRGKNYVDYICIWFCRVCWNNFHFS